MDRTPATAAQARAVGNPLRLRILRLCRSRERTNRELADRLGKDPSTVLHHTRVLVDAGLLEAAPQRPGPRGSTEKPYRATGLSWALDFDEGGGLAELSNAMLEAFAAELAEAGPDPVVSSSRFALHLDEAALEALAVRIRDVVDEALAGDDARREAGMPEVGGLLLFHRTPPEDDASSDAGGDHGPAAG